MNHPVLSQSDLPAWQRSASDEWVNALTHAFGFVLAVAGALVMAGSVMSHGDGWLIAGCGVYLISLVAVYAMSTLSHSVSSAKWKSWFRRLDQGCIYLLIVGTYTPFSLAYLQGGWSLFLGAMWCIAILGFAAKVFFAHQVDTASVVSYIVLGWMSVIAAPAFLQSMPAGALGAMLGGGVCYTAGTFFLVYDTHVRHFHALWHLCVIAGSACHFLGILVFVVGSGR